MTNIALCENGNIQLCDNGNIALCAPCTCPCGTWPGAYPWAVESCGGLLDEYAVSSVGRSIYDNTEITDHAWTWSATEWRTLERKATSNFTAKISSCVWGIYVSYRVLRYNGTRCEGPTTFKAVKTNWSPGGGFTVELSGCLWNMQSRVRSTGSTPTGTHSGVFVAPDGDPCWAGEGWYQHDLTLSEVAP